MRTTDRRMTAIGRRAAIAFSTALTLCPALTSGAIAQTPERVCGTFEYVYPHNVGLYAENHYIVLDCEGAEVRGRYYGTSDDFDRGRDSYEPGFHVSEMQDLVIAGNEIRFTLTVPDQGFFAIPVPFAYRSAQEAFGRIGTWRIRIVGEVRREYHGSVEADRIVLIIDGRERVFRRIDPDAAASAVPTAAPLTRADYGLLTEDGQLVTMDTDSMTIAGILGRPDSVETVDLEDLIPHRVWHYRGAYVMYDATESPIHFLITEPGFRTPRGVRIGDSVYRVIELYGLPTVWGTDTILYDHPGTGGAIYIEFEIDDEERVERIMMGSMLMK
jgi:hypothetical protein